MVADNSYRPRIPGPSPVKLPVDRTALVIIDMQNDFCRPNGNLFIGDTITPTIPRIKGLLDTARKHGMPVIHTQSWHLPDDPRFSDHPRASFGSKGCKAETWGAEIIDELQPASGEPAIKKDTYDPWFGTEMEQLLKTMGFGVFEHDSAQRNRLRHDCNVVITGTASDVCVDKAVIGFYFRGYQVIVPTDCISTRSEFAQDSALYRFSKQFYATLTRSDLVEFETGH